MAKKSIKVNYIFNLSYQILTLITPLITTPYISRVLKADGVGTYSYTMSIVSYFTLFAALGSHAFAQREISYYQENKEKISVIFWETVIFRTVMASISGFIYLIYVFTLSDDRLIALIQGLHIIALIFDVTWLLQGLEEFKKIVFRNLLVKIANIFYVFAVVKTATDLPKYVFGIAFFTLLGNILVMPYIKQYIKIVPVKKLKPFRNVKEMLQLFIPAVAIQVYTVMDKTMIGIMSPGIAENGYYEQSEKIAKIALTVVTSLGTVVAPRIAYSQGQKNNNEVKRCMYTTFNVIWMLTFPMCVGLICVASHIVPWFLGEGFEKCIALIQIFSFLIVAIGINNTLGSQYLIQTKKQNIYTITVTIGATTNLILNILLIPRLFSIGAAIASVIAETVIGISQIVFIVRINHELEMNGIFGSAPKYLIATGIMAVCLFAVKNRIPETFIGTCIMCIIGASVYLFSLIALKDQFLFRTANQFLKIISNKVKRKG